MFYRSHFFQFILLLFSITFLKMTAITCLTVSVRGRNLQPQKSYILFFFLPLLENALQNYSQHLGVKRNWMFLCSTSSSAGLFCLHFYLLYKLIKMEISSLTYSTGTLKKENWVLLLLLTEFAYLFQNNRVNHNCWPDSLPGREPLINIKICKIIGNYNQDIIWG